MEEKRNEWINDEPEKMKQKERKKDGEVKKKLKGSRSK